MRAGPSLMPKREGHGFGGYLLPMLSFLLILEIKSRVPEGVAPYFLPLQVLIPGALFLRYALRGSFEELRGFRPRPGEIALDVAIGIAGAALWVAPFVLIDSVRPADPGAFDPQQFGGSLVWLALGIRAIGYAVVTPFVEELFVRSWLLRYIDVFDRRKDFRDVPIARFTWRSFIGVMVFFTFSHMPWEWPVMSAWSLATQLWFYHRKHIAPLILIHATTNLSIFLFAVLANDRMLDGQGNPISLWFFI